MTYSVKEPLTHPVCVPTGDLQQALCARVVQLLREERERLGLSKYAMEQRSGVSQQMVGYLERGLRSPSLEIALRLAAALEVDLGDLIKRASKEQPIRKPRAAKK